LAPPTDPLAQDREGPEHTDPEVDAAETAAEVEWEYGFDARSLRAWRCKRGSLQQEWSACVVQSGGGSLAAPLAYFDGAVWQVSDITNQELKKLAKGSRGARAAATAAAASAAAEAVAPPPGACPPGASAQAPQAPPADCAAGALAPGAAGTAAGAAGTAPATSGRRAFWTGALGGQEVAVRHRLDRDPKGLICIYVGRKQVLQVAVAKFQTFEQCQATMVGLARRICAGLSIDDAVTLRDAAVIAAGGQLRLPRRGAKRPAASAGETEPRQDPQAEARAPPKKKGKQAPAPAAAAAGSPAPKTPPPPPTPQSPPPQYGPPGVALGEEMFCAPELEDSEAELVAAIEQSLGL
jgi:hypothetical protein